MTAIHWVQVTPFANNLLWSCCRCHILWSKQMFRALSSQNLARTLALA